MNDWQMVWLTLAALDVLGAPSEGQGPQNLPTRLQWLLDKFVPQEGVCKRWHDAIRQHLGKVAFLQVLPTPDGSGLYARWVMEIEHLPHFDKWYLGSINDEPTPEVVARIPKQEAA